MQPPETTTAVPDAGAEDAAPAVELVLEEEDDDDVEEPAFVDAFVLNAIDFWTKDDPLSASLEAEPQAPDSQVKVAAK